MRITFFGLLLCLVSLPVFAVDEYSIEYKISVNDETLHSPKISVYAGKEAKVITQDYELTLVATTQTDDQVSISTNLTIDGTTIDPKLLVKLGKEASISIDETTLTIVVQRYAEDNT